MLNYTRLKDDKRWSTINQMNEENSQIEITIFENNSIEFNLPITFAFTFFPAGDNFYIHSYIYK